MTLHGMYSHDKNDAVYGHVVCCVQVYGKQVGKQRNVHKPQQNVVAAWSTYPVQLTYPHAVTDENEEAKQPKM